jgi:uncharacterized protein (TIRG00374 family)
VKDTRGFGKNVLRWGFAALLFLWLFKSGKLEGLRNLDKLLDAPGFLALALSGLIFNYVFNFYRWKLLLQGVNIDMPMRQVVRLSMIGQFFSIIMPGAVGGDLIKAVYIAKQHSGQRTDAIASILLDRILGFLTLMLFATIFFLLSFDPAHLPRSVQGFGTLLALGTLALVLIVLLPGQAVKLMEKYKSEHPLVVRISKTLKAFARHPLTIIQGLLISIVSQGGAILGMYFIGKSLYGPLPWGNLDGMRFISATAVGTTASALPLSPMGLGIGQVAFGKVFKILGAPSEEYGIVIVSAVQILSFVLNLSGAIWFLNSKKELQAVS